MGKEIKRDEEKKNWRIIYFNAWKYEKLDPVKSLMQFISTAYDNGNSDWKEITKNYGFIGLSAGLKLFFGLNLRDELESAKEYWSITVEKLKTISETLGDLIGEGRLIVFIDDLDRCSIDTALDTLLSIKVLFNSRNSIFLVAADFNEYYTALYPMLFEKSQPTGVRLGYNFSIGFQNFQYLPASLKIMVNDESIFDLFREGGKHYQISLRIL